MKRVSIQWMMLSSLLCYAGNLQSQALSFSTFDIGATYTEARSFTDDSVDHAENYGFGMELKIKAHSNVRVGLSFNYTPLQITEFDPWVAMTRTGWDQWTVPWSSYRTYSNIRDQNGNPLYD